MAGGGRHSGTLGGITGTARVLLSSGGRRGLCRAGGRHVGVVVGSSVILAALAWVLVVRGSAMMGAGLLAPLVDRLGHRLREDARRDRAGALRLRLYLYLWLLAFAVWMTVFAMMLMPPK